MIKKMFFIFPLFVVNAFVVAQDSPLQIKKDKLGRPYFTDKENDQIVIIDFKARGKLKKIVIAKNQLSSKGLDYGNFYQVTPGENIDLYQNKAPEYKLYEVSKGESWEDIAMKIYKDRNFSPYLKLWNEDLLGDLNIREGVKIKYLEKIK